MIVSLTPDGRKIRYCTYLGGSGNDFSEHRLGVLPDGSVLMTGFTNSKSFPTTEGAYQHRRGGK